MDDPRATIHFLAPRNLGPAKPVKASPSYVSAGMRPEEAFRAALSDCLAQIAANAAALRAGRSEEGLHQLRVAFRRLEVALGAFGREFEQEWLGELRGRAKILSHRLAPARDLDVFIGELLEAAPDKETSGFAALRDRAEAARELAWHRVQACIAAPEFERFTDDVAALTQSLVPLTRQRRLAKTASRMLDRQIRRVKKRGRTAHSQEQGDLHRLRIALKKLRYTAEFFAPLYKARDVKAYLKQVRGLQNYLGELNDVANVRAVVGELLQPKGARKEDDAGLRFAAGTLVGWYAAQTPRASRQALKRYVRFCKVTPFWK